MSVQTERLGRWVRTVREAWGWDREDIIRYDGPGDSTQRRIEPKDDGTMSANAPSTVSKDVLKQYAAAFGVGVDELRQVQAGRQIPIPERPQGRAPSSTAAPNELRTELNELRERISVLEASAKRTDSVIQRIEDRL